MLLPGTTKEKNLGNLAFNDDFLDEISKAQSMETRAGLDFTGINNFCSMKVHLQGFGEMAQWLETLALAVD